MFKGGGVEGEDFPTGVELAALDPGSVAGIRGRAPRNVDSKGTEVVGAAGGEVDEPTAVDVMQLGCLDMVAFGTGGGLGPDGEGSRCGKSVEGGGPAQFDAVIGDGGEGR